MGIKLLSTGFLLCSFIVQAADEKPLDFNEVFNLIRTNITDVSESELKQSAAFGLISQLGSRVQLVSTNAEPAAQPPDAITRRSVFEGQLGYIRVRSVDKRLPSDFRQSLTQLVQSNSLKGLILDLRYAEGTNYQAAAEVAELFVPSGQPVMRIGAQQVTSKARPITRLPLAALANGETRAGAEAIVAALRETASGLVIGSKTRGEALLFETFQLSTGQSLRIGKVPIEVGSGKVIPASGIEPDVTVSVEPEEEKLFYLDSYRERRPSTRPVETSANRARRLNEAELVRRHREGFDFSEDTAEPVSESTVVTDPALSRAIDVLKGLSKLSGRPPF